LHYRKRIAFLPTDDYLYPRLTCLENIEYATILRTGKKTLLNETCGLIHYFEAEGFLDKRFADCSTGMKKKIQLIVSLVGDIDTIIWDEPNDGLDIVSNMKIKHLLNHYKGKNATIVLSCHVIEFLDNFIDYCIVLKDGSVVESAEVNGPKALQELYTRHIDERALRFPFD
jgi:ABC-type multidrug transport system ATPase subunit